MFVIINKEEKYSCLQETKSDPNIYPTNVFKNEANAAKTAKYSFRKNASEVTFQNSYQISFQAINLKCVH